MASFTISVNGTPRTVTADKNDYLLYILRDKLELTGPKYGCGVGVCGACTCNSSTPIVAEGGNGNSPYSPDSRFSGTQPTTQKNKFRTCVTRIGDVGVAAGSTPAINITTIEGLSGLPNGPALQAAWEQFDVAQCGFCQAGQLMSAYEYLTRVKGAATDEGITNAMQANMCRCGTYPRIRAAMMAAAPSFR